MFKIKRNFVRWFFPGGLGLCNTTCMFYVCFEFHDKANYCSLKNINRNLIPFVDHVVVDKLQAIKQMPTFLLLPLDPFSFLGTSNQVSLHLSGISHFLHIASITFHLLSANSEQLHNFGFKVLSLKHLPLLWLTLSSSTSWLLSSIYIPALQDVLHEEKMLCPSRLHH